MTAIRISSILFLLFFLSCQQEASSIISKGKIIKKEFTAGDTLYKNKDTIILKYKDWLDTLVKYKPVSDSAYFVKPENIRLSKTLDFSSYEYKKLYITVTKNRVKENGVNFAGHYCFVYWGCGLPCQLSAVVDLKTGKVYNGLPASIGYSFKKDSRLLVINPPDSTNWYHPAVFYTIPEEYIWTGKGFKKLKKNL